jgi:5-methylcytosine-specific restriction enzyme subunit McrC
MLISICYLIVKGLLQTNSDGTKKLMDFIDEQRMSRLYEKFILEYFRKEHPEIMANASQIPWQLDDDTNAMLPVMQTDIMLIKDEKTLIIDAKYYYNTMQTQYDVHTLHSGNLYQIFTYVKNKESQLSSQPHEVSGMLLYARTDEAVLPNNTYRMSGNRISVRTLDLDCNFEMIAAQLDTIASEYFGVSA